MKNDESNDVPNLTVFGQRLLETSPNKVNVAVLLALPNTQLIEIIINYAYGRDSSFWRYKVCCGHSVGFSRKETLKDSVVAHSRVNARLALCVNISTRSSATA